MDHVTSADGTRIAYAQTGAGAGDPVIVINGAFSTAGDAAPLAEGIAAAGYRAVTYDRRARGDSGDTPPVDPAREVDDLEAVIAAVGRASVLGHSSGAILGLFAAASGASISHLFLSEPPFRFGDGEPASDLPERLQAMIDEGKPADAVETFQREAIELPDDVIAQIRASAMFDGLVALAQSVVYDATLTRAVSTPTPAMLDIDVPVTIVCGVQTFPFLVASAQRLAREMPAAELVVVPKSVGHRPDPAATARVIAERLG